MDFIKIKGARENNLKDININIPKNKFVVFTGVSGSGKSSLVHDTIFAEAQRQYIESFSSFARRLLPKFSRPEMDEIEGLTPVVMIDQKSLGRTPRSTVGTVTEIYTYLRLLYSRVGKPFVGWSNVFSFNRPEGMCKKCKGIGVLQEPDPNLLVDFNKSLNEGAIKLSFCKPGSRTLNIIKVANKLDFDKKIKDYTKEELDFLLYSPHIVLSNKDQGFIQTFSHEGIVVRLKRYMYGSRDDTDWSEDLQKAFAKEEICPECNGARINEKARSVKVVDKSIPELINLELVDLRTHLKTINGDVAEPIIRKLNEILTHLIDIGVGYLSLNQPVGTLSGGESQRVKMAKQLGNTLVGMTYVLDEPSVGLHPRDISSMIKIIKKLRDRGNSVLVVEHDPSVIEEADYVIDMGPEAGKKGGKITYEGEVAGLKKAKCLTGEYLAKNSIPIKRDRRKANGAINISNASLHNLKNVSVDVPKGILTCITGVAGSGKSSLVEIFLKENPKSIVVDQSSPGRSVRSNPATYTQVFGLIRNAFAKESKKDASYFSFNSKGACPKCKGVGHIKIEMSFLDDVTVECDSCQGKKYTDEALSFKYKNKNIFEVLAMTINEAYEFFDSKEIKRRLSVLKDVGLGYLELGQSLDSLSGGEAQRIKLARELHKKGNIYVLDEPTTGLHMANIEKLLEVLNKLVDNGNTVIVIEHNLDVIKNSDWIIDLGPEGGSKGGKVLFEGTPEDIKGKASTGKYLAKFL